MFKSSVLSLAVLATLGASSLPVAAAEEASPLSYNLSLTTDYRYRGLSQSRLQPALQGGVDYAGPNGLYLGAWASTIKWIKDAGGHANVELDLYGGWKGEVAKDLTLDVGLLSYVYANHDLAVAPNTTEFYGALTYSIVTAKYSHSVTNLFGVADSKNSGYLDLSANIEVGDGWTVTPHVGHQRIKGFSAGSYTDYAVTVSKTFGAWTPSLTVLDTNADESLYTLGGKYIGKTGVVAAVKYAF